MTSATKAWNIARLFGPRFVAQRIGISIRKRLGVTRRVFRSRPWDSLALADLVRPGTPTNADEYAQFRTSAPPPFLFPLGQPPELPQRLRNPAAERQPDFAARIAALRDGRCVYFFRTLSPERIDWYANPFDGMLSQRGVPWYEIPDYLPGQGDPRMMWEPARAAWAIDLARAPAHGLADDAGELLWRWVDDWMAACPPFEGFHWKCGQESSVRLIAIALGVCAHGRAPTTTPDRWLEFARLAWATGYRVAHHIDYAISQKNNHAISEAVGLMLVAHLFPEFRDAQKWWHKGRTVLDRELRRQIYADGSYVQHSMNYHRVMLHGALLGFRLGELAGQPFGRELYELLGRSSEFVFQMTDPLTGRAPNYGNNDGALVLPLSECDFTDFRPVVQAIHHLVHRRRLLPEGPWDEDLAWLFGADALSPDSSRTSSSAGGAPPISGRAQNSGLSTGVPSRPEEGGPARPERTSHAFDSGGYYTLRTAESWAMIRCHTYRDRPAQCDQLHLDLWWRGLNVLLDAGTHHYYVPGRPDIEHYFKSMRAHNNVELDGVDPLELVSRFVWLPWPRARLLRFDLDERQPQFEGETSDYDRPPHRVLHRRAVLALHENAWLVIDDILGTGIHDATVRWHMPDFPARKNGATGAVQDTPVGRTELAVASDRPTGARCELIRASDEPGRVQGWIAPYYGERLPAVAFEATFHEELPLRVCTLIALGVTGKVSLNSGARDCEARAGDAAWSVRLGPLERESRWIIESHNRQGAPGAVQAIRPSATVHA